LNFVRPASILLVLSGSSAHAQWQPQAIDTDADFRGLYAVSTKIAWVSGTKGTFGRTTDGGKKWVVGTVAGAEKLDFRDVKAVGADIAYLLSAGPGGNSRIYATSDGGKTWVMQFQNADPSGFFDALAFWDEKHGVAIGDPVKGRFQILTTDDAGKHWMPQSDKNLPIALAGEGLFAASGTCLIARGESDAWFVTGGAKVTRVFHSTDRGRTWAGVETPVKASIASAGIFSISFRDNEHGVIVGGDYARPDGKDATAAVTANGGKTWTLIHPPLPYRSAVAWAKDRWVAVGTSGSHASFDEAKTWKVLDGEKYNSVSFTPSGEGWAAGPKGRIAKFVHEH